LDRFFAGVKYPIVIVSTLPKRDRETVTQYLETLNAPVYLEAVSGLREEPRLQHLRVSFVENIWDLPVDGILRIGGVPTPRFWRDLEMKEGEISVLSISHLPWSGLTWGEVKCGEYDQLLSNGFSYSEPWYRENAELQKNLHDLFLQFPRAEPSLMHGLSKCIPAKSLVYLGNSLPIREWDLGATNEFKELDIFASRGMNGIDGQLSTFLGMCQPDRSNWCVLGDLTTLYDLAGPWILDQLQDIQIQLVVVNNGGGMIFSRMKYQESFLNRHTLNFQHFAKMWNLDYEHWFEIGGLSNSNRLVEIEPCPKQTQQFWDFYTHRTPIV